MTARATPTRARATRAGRDSVANIHLVANDLMSRARASCVGRDATHHENPHLFLGEETLEEFGERDAHVCVTSAPSRSADEGNASRWRVVYAHATRVAIASGRLAS
jgi:hypothetical protein